MPYCLSKTKGTTHICKPQIMIKIRNLQRTPVLSLVSIPKAHSVPCSLNLNAVRLISNRCVECTFGGTLPKNSFINNQTFTKNDLERKLFSTSLKYNNVESETSQDSSEDAKEPTNTNKNTEVAKGEGIKHEFQADTRQLLDIVASSLYSEKEVFIRELISNASDAIEKFRYLRITGEQHLNDPEREPLIDIETDKIANTITFRDNGIGMTSGEMVQNLGTIARSGSKAFMKEVSEKLAEGQQDPSNATNPESIIGQFGVGFYSAFMVADKIEVFSKSSLQADSHTTDGRAAHHWSTDGSGSYTVKEAEGVSDGTKIVVHLKSTCTEFSDEANVREIIKKFSSFVGSNVTLNGAKSNDLRPVWLMDPKEVEAETHEDFYRYIANAVDKPRFTHHFRTDAPMDIRALLYVPESRPGLFETSREGDAGVALYCRKVLIKSKTENIVPKWMRFVKGVVDSEDIPLNLSREILQDSSQIRKLRTVITNKFLRFLGDRAKKDNRSYGEFYKDYGFFLKEGIITGTEQYEKEEIAKLLMFESSTEEGKLVSIPEYCGRMKPGQRDIYYLAATSRQLAESSPYYEAMKKKDVEILFCYESYDELVLMQLQQFDNKRLKSAEKEMREDPKDEQQTEEGKDALDNSASDSLSDWMKTQLGTKAAKVKVTRRLESHPCVITIEEMAAGRHFIKTQGANFTEEQRYNILQPQLEINPSHEIIKKLATLRTSNPKLASLITEQLFANAMVGAGLVEDPRTILRSMNDLLTEALSKH